jgi:DNA-binding Lrp family transcriptional regulator
LRKAGYIRGVTAILNIAKIFPSIVVFAKINLAEQTVRQFTIFETAIQIIPEVLECSLMSGEFNYFLKVIARDLEHFNELTQTMMEMGIGIKSFDWPPAWRPNGQHGACRLPGVQPRDTRFNQRNTAPRKANAGVVAVSLNNVSGGSLSEAVQRANSAVPPAN